MRVKDVMTREAEVIYPDTTLKEAAELMKSLDVGALPVVDGERLLGMITDRDITVRATAAGADPCSARVRDAMTPEVIYCLEEQDATEAAGLMRENQIRRLPVLNADRLLVGMVSLGDLAVHDDSTAMAAMALSGVSEPAEPQRGPFSGLLE